MLTPHGWLEVKESRNGREHRRVADVLSQCYPQEAWTARDVAQFAERGGNAVKVMALDDGVIIGCLLYRVREDVVEVARIAVAPQFRRCRAAAYALRTLTGPTSIARRGVYEFRLHEENDAGRLFVAKCGFSATGVVREHFRDRRDAYVFKLFKEVPVRHPETATVS